MKKHLLGFLVVASVGSALGWWMVRDCGGFKGVPGFLGFLPHDWSVCQDSMSTAVWFSSIALAATVSALALPTLGVVLVLRRSRRRHRELVHDDLTKARGAGLLMGAYLRLFALPVALLVAIRFLVWIFVAAVRGSTTGTSAGTSHLLNMVIVELGALPMLLAPYDAEAEAARHLEELEQLSESQNPRAD